jgi:transposase
MKIVGCDLHTRYQQIAMLDQDTGELIERRLEHESGEARAFYTSWAGPVRVGIEATGHTRWFERMLAELGHELWIGDAAQIRASMVRKQKTDARDAAHLLELLLSGRFPSLWRPSMAERDLRQLVWHRQKLVWMRNAIGNQLGGWPRYPLEKSKKLDAPFGVLFAPGGEGAVGRALSRSHRAQCGAAGSRPFFGR